jgi:DNA polymerase-3 subunit alpha
MEFDLLFERFLNPARISMPDIDTDFEDTARDQVIEYIRERYGKEKVAHIGTYMTMAAKAAFKDVARIFGVNFTQSNEYAALISESTIEKSIEKNEELRKVLDQDERFSKILSIAKNLEGSVR